MSVRTAVTGLAAEPLASARAGALQWRLLLMVAACTLAVHLAVAGRYGYFRDELYFLDCGRHLDWGYVDHAPLIAFLARVALALGASLPVLRALPAVAGAGLVVLTGALAWRLGGGRFAQALAALSVLAAPIYLGIDSLFTMNAFEPLFWMGAVYVLVRILDTGEGRRWALFGLLVGLGLMNKHSTLFFAGAIGAGLLLTPDRRQFTGRWPWVGALVALLVFSPNLVWQVRHDFPTIELLQNVAHSGKNVVLGPMAFLKEQILILHPVLFPLWVAGLVYLFIGRDGRWRSLGWAFWVFVVAMLTLKAKSYYLAPMYPMLFAGGAVAVDDAVAAWVPTGRQPWARVAVIGLVAVTGVPTALVAMPILSPERFVAYQDALGFGPPRMEARRTGRLPQIFGDQFGWPEFVADVARVYHALPPDEQRRAVIFATNYGQAGAVNFFGPAYGLPRAVSGHQNYFLWGYGDVGPDPVVISRGARASLERECRSVEQAGEHDHPWGMPDENGPIFVCRGLKTPLAELWPRMKAWY